MKLEIEITEEEIRSAIERKVRTAVADQTNNYRSDDVIRKMVKNVWPVVAERLIAELMGNSETLKGMIDKAVESRVKARVAAALKR